MLFLVNPDDTKELDTLRALNVWHVVVPWQNGPRDYAMKMNYGVKMTSSDWILLGADDIKFHPGWWRAATQKHIETGALVIGTNDLCNPHVLRGKHATHALVHRDYVARGTVDSPDKLLHDGYFHNSVDDEFCETAQARGEWAFARDAIVEHRHPVFDRTIRRDTTYRKGLQFAVRDKLLCNERRSLWDPKAPPLTQLQRKRLHRARPMPVAYWPER